MKANFLKHSYGYLLALVVTMQLVAAPIALSAEELTVESMAEMVVPNNECQGGACG